MRINGRSMEADTVRVSREDGEITLFEDGGKLFCHSTGPVAPARFAPNTVCLDFARKDSETRLYRALVESRMNRRVPLVVGDHEPPGCGNCAHFLNEGISGEGWCDKLKRNRMCYDECKQFWKRRNRNTKH